MLILVVIVLLVVGVAFYLIFSRSRRIIRGSSPLRRGGIPMDDDEADRRALDR